MIESYKLQFSKGRVRIALTGGAPGVDIVGEATAPLFIACVPLLDWLRARDPSVVVRALYIHPCVPRAIVSLEAPQQEQTKPWVLRLDGQDAAAFLDEAPELPTLMAHVAEKVLAGRIRRDA